MNQLPVIHVTRTPDGGWALTCSECPNLQPRFRMRATADVQAIDHRRRHTNHRAIPEED